jgi:hypothetical protein
VAVAPQTLEGDLCLDQLHLFLQAREELAHLQQRPIRRRLNHFLAQDFVMLGVMKTEALYLNKL